MKKIFLSLAVAVAALTASVSSVKAADVEFGADVVSTYVARGMYQTGASIQPAASVSFGDFSIGTWASTAITSNDAKEVDFSLTYSIGSLDIMFIDYWWSGQGVKYFDADEHYYEVGLGYSIGGFSIAAYTYLAGADKDENGDLLYSTYIDLAYGFAVKDVDCSVGVSFTPAAGMYADKADVCAVTLGAAKSVKITDSFELPLFAQVILAPASNDAFVVFGMSF